NRVEKEPARSGKTAQPRVNDRLEYSLEKEIEGEHQRQGEQTAARVIQDVDGGEEISQSNQHLPDHRTCRARMPPEKEMNNSGKQQQPGNDDAHRNAGDEGQA